MIKKTTILTKGLYDKNIKFVGKCPKCNDYVFERGNAWICMGNISNLCDFKAKNNFQGNNNFPSHTKSDAHKKVETIKEVNTQNSSNTKQKSSSKKTLSYNYRKPYYKKSLNDFNTGSLIKEPTNTTSVDEEYLLYLNIASSQK